MLTLLNASIKLPDFKNQLTYSEIKGNVSRILHYLISLEFNKYELDFYINPTERCAYIEIYGLQFSFHNININDTINVFIDSDKNKKNLGKGKDYKKLLTNFLSYQLIIRK